MNYRTFAWLLALFSAGFGVLRYVTDSGPMWQIPVLAILGFAASYFLGFVIWVAVAPEDAFGVAKEMLGRLRNGRPDA
ncbi:MAG: hypothetical protein Q8J99_01495 [Sulfuritalea sp.]|nr:hypothetical protein [Sulfuritalea sp.]